MEREDNNLAVETRHAEDLEQQGQANASHVLFGPGDFDLIENNSVPTIRTYPAKSEGPDDGDSLG